MPHKAITTLANIPENELNLDVENTRALNEIRRLFEVELISNPTEPERIAKEADTIFVDLINMGELDLEALNTADEVFCSITARLPALLTPEAHESLNMQSLVYHLVRYRYSTLDLTQVGEDEIKQLDSSLYMALAYLADEPLVCEIPSSGVNEDKFLAALLEDISNYDETAYRELIESMLADFYGFNGETPEIPRKKAKHMIAIWENCAGAYEKIETESGSIAPDKNLIKSRKINFVAESFDRLAYFKREGELDKLHTLNFVCNITNFARYYNFELKKMYDVLNNGYQEGDKTALSIWAQTDWNGGLSEYRKVKNTNVTPLEEIVIEANSLHEVLKYALRASKYHQQVRGWALTGAFNHPYDYVLINAHGTIDRLEVGEWLDLLPKHSTYDLTDFEKLWASLDDEQDSEEYIEDIPETIFDASFDIDVIVANLQILQQALNRYKLLASNTQLGLHACNTNKKGGDVIGLEYAPEITFTYDGENIAQVLKQALNIENGVAPETEVSNYDMFKVMRNGKLTIASGQKKSKTVVSPF